MISSMERGGQTEQVRRVIKSKRANMALQQRPVGIGIQLERTKRVKCPYNEDMKNITTATPRRSRRQTAK